MTRVIWGVGHGIIEAFEVADNATSLPRPSTSRLQTVKTAPPDSGGGGRCYYVLIL